MKVAITNTTLLNGGDAAINEATMLSLRSALGAGTEFVCYDARPEISARYFPRLDLRATVFDRVAETVGPTFLRRATLVAVLVLAWAARYCGGAVFKFLPSGLRRDLHGYLTADVIVSAGGTYITEHYRLAPRIVEFLVVLALGRPLVLFTQSIGMPVRRRDRVLLRFVFRRAVLIMVRDTKSAENLAALGVRSRKIVQCPDAAFALACDAGKAVGRARATPGNPPRVAISVRDWPFFRGPLAVEKMTAYLNAVAGFVRRVIEEDNGEVTLISTCQGIPEYWTDDSRTARSVLSQLPPHIMARVTIDSAFRTPAGLIERFGDFDCIVATRMHAAILALCTRVPVVPIAYEFKTRELFDALTNGRKVLDIETVTADELYAQWQAAGAAEASGNAASLWRRVEDCRRKALESGRFVARAIAAAGTV